MKGTGIVGYIALLMILWSFFGRGGHGDFWALRANALGASSYSTTNPHNPGFQLGSDWMMQNPPLPLSLSISETIKPERYVRIMIDGIPYEGTIHANPSTRNPS